MVRDGASPGLDNEEVNRLLDAIETDANMGLRDRALIATMLCMFGRVSIASLNARFTCVLAGS